MIDMCVHRLHRHAFPWTIRFSYRNAAFLVCSFNIVIAILLFQAFFGSSSRRSWVQMTEAEAIRRAMVPFQLIKRIKEIQEEANTETAIPVEGASQKQSATSNLSKRLKDFQALNDANSKKVIQTVDAHCDFQKFLCHMEERLPFLEERRSILYRADPCIVPKLYTY